jgi:subtilisin family serine protease
MSAMDKEVSKTLTVVAAMLFTLGLFFSILHAYAQSPDLLTGHSIWDIFKKSTASSSPPLPPPVQKLDASPILTNAEPDFAPQEILIKVKKNSNTKIKEHNEDAGIPSLTNLNKKYHVKGFEKMVKSKPSKQDDADIYRWYKATLSPDSVSQDPKNARNQIHTMIYEYKKDPNIEAAEPNYRYSMSLAPNDPFYTTTGTWGQPYADLYGMKKINAEQAWDQTTGSTSIVVADIDTGVDRNHEDIAANMWVNTREIPNNGIDDDNNGYIDDYYGWDFVNNDNDPIDDNGHGTHTAGTIAATGNNGKGVVGVNWNSKIMALKFLSAGGSGFNDDAINSLLYALNNGARVASNSWGGFGYDAALDDAITYVHDRGLVVVAAAGNSNTDALNFFPAGSDDVITVAASDYNDARAYFSNWGAKIDVAAPGVDILSLRAANTDIYGNGVHIVNSTYYRASGTSMATPHVAGLAALILSKYPALKPEDVRQILRTASDDLGTPGKDISFGYGRINAYRSVSNTQMPLSPFFSNLKSGDSISNMTLFTLTGGVPGPNFASYTVDIGKGSTPTSWIPLSTSNVQVTNGNLGTLNFANVDDDIYTFRITATNTLQNTYQFQIYNVQINNFVKQISEPSTYIPTHSVIDIIGSADGNIGLTFANYTLSYIQVNKSTGYSTVLTNGITLMNGGLLPVRNGVLARWDTSVLSPEFGYSLVLTIYSKEGKKGILTLPLVLDDKLVAGWPKFITHECPADPHYNPYQCVSFPSVADLYNDGKKEVIAGAVDKVYVYDKSGHTLPGFPFSLGAGELFNWAANAEDLDGDGKKEIIFSSIMPDTYSRKLYIIKNDGTAYPGWPTPVFTQTYASDYFTPTIADIDNDGKKELLFMEVNGKLHALKPNGLEVSGFPKTLPTIGWYPRLNVPAIADMDHDGRKEIAIGMGGMFYLLDNQGNILPGWPKNYTWPYDFNAIPSFADVDGDGTLEVVEITTGGGLVGKSVPIFVWKKDGSIVPGWPKQTAQSVNSYMESSFTSASAADLDGDGKDELIVGSWYVSIYNSASSRLLKAQSDTHPALSDINGDGHLDISSSLNFNSDNSCQSGTSSLISISSSDTGTILFNRFFCEEWIGFTPPLFADLDNDGKMEFISSSYGTVGTNGGTTLPITTYVWEVGSNSNTEWPLALHDSAHTGRVTMNTSPAPTKYQLSVGKSGTGSGTVSSSPSGITCGSVCSATYASGTSVTLTPIADASSSFIGWNGCDSVSGNNCIVTLQASRSVTAQFDIIPVVINYTLSAAKSGTGSGVLTSNPAGVNCGSDCSESYASNTVVAVTAMPSAGSVFSKWLSVCTSSSTQFVPTCPVLMNADKNLIAEFLLNTTPVNYSLSITKSGTGFGAVTSNPAGINCGSQCTANYMNNVQVVLSPAANAGSIFGGWSGCDSISGFDCIVTMVANKVVTANFIVQAPITYSLSVTKSGTGSGIVTSSPAGISCGSNCSALFNYGSYVTLTASASQGSVFSGWTGCETVNGNNCVVNMLSSKSVTATFDGSSPFDFSLSNSGNNAVVQGSSTTNSITTTIIAGTSQPVSFSVSGLPNGVTGAFSTTVCNPTCTTVLTLSASSTATVGTTTVTVTGISGIITKTTSFVLTVNPVAANYALTVTKSGVGSGTVTSSPAGITCGSVCSATYASGTSVSLTAAPNSGNTFTGWSGACTGAGSCVVTMDAAKSVNAIFDVSGGGVLDTVPPIVTIVSPANNSVIVTSSTKVAVSAVDNPGGTGVSNIKIYVDNILVKTCTGVSSCTYTWNVKKTAAGLHVLKGTATDKSGNIDSKNIFVSK